MQIRHFYTPGLSINSYLIFDEKSKKGALIDPTRQVDLYLASALKENIEITDIFETHVHADYVSGAPEIKAALLGKPRIHSSGMGGKEWIPSHADHTVMDHDQVLVGNIRLEAFHTPGHTPEHLLWLVFDEGSSKTVPCLAFTGDFIFAGGVGRPDLLGQERVDLLTKQLFESLSKTLKTLPEFLQLLPGHGADSLCGKEISSRETTTLGYEKQCNSSLVLENYSHWRNELMKDMPIAPPYYQRLKKMNVLGIDKKNERDKPQIISKDQIDESFSQCMLVDVRSLDVFAKQHLKGSINIPFISNFPMWSGSVLDLDKEIILIVDSAADALPVIQTWRLIGLDNVRRIVLANQWQKEMIDDDFSSLPTINVEDVTKIKADLFVLDVRTPAEWHSGHISGAHHLELTRVVAQLDRLPKDQPIAVICRSGTRASIVASLLKTAGFNSMNIRGGMMAWERAKLPIEKT